MKKFVLIYMKQDKSKINKEYYFILYLKKVLSEEIDDKVQFTSLVDKDNIPRCILTKEKDEFIVKIFKFNPKLTNDIKNRLEFFYDGKKYDLSLEKPKDKSFLFDVDATFQSSKRKLDQTKIDITEKMNYFEEALGVQKEYEKMNTLYNDSITQCSKKPSFQFLINIFVKIYNTELCSKLLDIFTKKIDKLVENNNKEKLQKYKFDFDQIIENRDDIISKFNLNPYDFYGLIFCYLNICNKEKFKELFSKLSTKEEGKKIIFEVMLSYKLFFKKQIDISNDLLNEFIKYSTQKDFKIFKDDALYYLKDINTFLEIMENSKDDIIKIKNFEPIEALKINDDEDIKFGIINPKIEKITDFSKGKKKLLLDLDRKFWESLAKKSSGISRDNIELCSTIRIIFINYYNMVKEILPEKDKIRQEIKTTFNNGIFTRQIDKIIREYIANNPDINNKDIIELIRDYDEYYKNKAYIKKRDPKILEKIDLDKKSENFIKMFKEMQFENIFALHLNNYLIVITNKIKKVSDFDVIFKLININALGDAKELYLKTLKNKYDLVAKTIASSENDENLIKSLVNLITYICINENKIEFLEDKINKSKYINQNIKHKIYIGLINFCKENSNQIIKNMKNFIIKHYTSSLKPEKLKEFIDFIINLSEDDANNFIENIDDKYNIIEKEFYSKGINLNIQLLNELLIKNKLNFNDDNKYIKANIGTISKIANDIEDKKIQFEYLKNFVDDEKEIVKEKLNLLTLAPNNFSDQDEKYENILQNYKEMKDDLDKLSLYKKTLEVYHSQIKQKEISNINKYIEIIQKETFFNYNDKTKSEIQTLFDESQNIVKDIEDVKNSKIFKIFFQKESRNNKIDKSNPFDKAYEEFTNFKKLLVKNGADIIKKDSQNDIIKKIKEQYKEDKAIQNELSSLISGEQQNEEEIMILLNAKNFEKDLNSIFEFFSYFKNNENLKRELDEWTEKCQDLSNEQDNSKIQTILNELKKAGIYDYRNNLEKKCNYITFFNLFFENKQALAFLDQNTAEDIKPLYDKIIPGADLTINNISDTINCVGFFQELKKIEGGLKEIIDHIKAKLDKKDLNILEGFKRYLEIYRAVIELNENFDFAQSIYKEISEIINESKFIFNKNNDEINVINRDKDDLEYKIITFDKIRELKNKIQLKQEGKKDSLQDANSNNYIKRYEKLKFFKDLTVKIEEIKELMTVLRMKGSTLSISICVNITYPDVYYTLDGKKRDFKEIHDFLTKAKTNIINKLDSIYKDMTTIRFLYGKQIDCILNHIQGSTKINSFLRYILNYTDSNEVKEGKKFFMRKTLDYINETNNYNNDSFNIIHDYIISLFNENGTSIENHYKKISIKERNKLKGIYTYFSKSDSLEEDILRIYLDKVGKVPIAQNILINSKETSYEEMQAFFHRAILCQYNTLFVVELNGSFSPYQQRCMNIFLDKILTFKNNEYNNKNFDNHVDKSNTSLYMESCLVFIYNKNDESFLNELKPFNPQILIIDEIDPSLKCQTPRQSFSSITSSIFTPKRQDLYNNTHIVQSEICGLGKSTQIRNKIKESKKEYIYFPLGGNITKDIIYNKLYSIMNDINNKTLNNYNDIAIHLDLFDSKENIVSILNEFLFSFLITKFYSNNENVIFIPTNIEIYIEIPNTFKDFISNYGILKFFQRDDDMIIADDLPQLKLPKDKINLFKKMLGKDENEEIYKWLKEMINIKRYSYHQIHIFINLFISQYNIFKGRKIYFSKDGEDVTKDCIDHFALATKYFTYGGFSKLLLDKEDNLDNNVDEIDILSKVYKNDLEKETFDEKLIFIVKNKDNKFGGNLLGIFYELDISTKALDNGEALGKLSEKRKKEREEKKKTMTIEMFKKLEYLEILKKILDLDNPVLPNENNDEKLISLLEIIDKDDYVMTTDNFRKMILILCRIIANIPVILMGETGCGKTALIKKLNQLINNGQETLESINIDPGYDEEKLTKKMNEINEKAKSCKGELWVFFDELNTCDSLSLITEIFINRTYGRKKLEKNIRLIGACNPYRKKKEDKNICGLTYKNNDEKNEVELVYLVNILPQSLMYYIFNFGTLAKGNEDQYISSIISDIIPDPKLKEATKNVISKCHDYLRETFDPSVVSLREMKRFKKIYLFLLEYYENKKQLDPKKSGSEESIKLKSIIISIYLCYYSRLVDKETRNNFVIEMDKPFKQLVNYNSSNKSDENNSDSSKNDEMIFNEDLKKDLNLNYNIVDFKLFHFNQILSYEQDFILNNISLNKGIGKNTSLKENIFLLFIALATNIPLIIIGKPGSSKSLSAQLIYKEMGGKYSKKDFFKFYPSIIQTYFQGANSTKPKDVDEIFNKAEGRLKALKCNNNELPISMILFDELGLAERSIYNPLKALHSNLEIDGSSKEGKEKGISFVGISNWTLDASKTNRALILSVPDLDSDLDDLKETSKSICESINDSFGSNKIFSTILPNVYYQFKENLKILQMLTVYKEFELQEYKILIDTYKEDEEFQNIFSDVKECKIFFEKKKPKDKELKEEKIEEEENGIKIYEYKIFQKVKDKLKVFCESKKKKKKEKNKNFSLFGESILSNNNYKRLLEKDRKIKLDFLGNRDFYFIIKEIAHEMNDNNVDYKNIIQKYIERNFGGFEIPIDFENDYSHLKEFEKYKDVHYKDFFEKIQTRPKWTSVQIFEIVFNIYCNRNDEADSIIDEAVLDGFKYLENIKENIRDVKSRYLLLGINSSHASVIHQKISKEIKKTIYFYEGSPFVNDNNNEYIFKIINKIQEHAENGDIIILHNLSQVYPFLYDLFNKNFMIKDGKQYARICLGNYSELHAIINRGFRVIVMVNKKYLDKVELPFLNRFEKIVFSFSQLIDENQKKLAEIISSELDMKKYENIYRINYRIKNLLIGCQTEFILGMIFYELDLNEKGAKDENDRIKTNINNKIYKLLPQDIIMNLDNDILRKLYFSKKQYYNLEQYLNSKPTHKISIIYTFNNINSLINCIDETSSFKMISQIKSENQLFNNINNMITEKANNKNINKNKNYIFIHFDELNSDKIGFLISFVINYYDKNEEFKFIFIVHIKRNFKVDPPCEKIFAIPDINSKIYQIFIDNLNGPDIKLEEIIYNPINELKKKDLINIENEFDNALKKFTDDNLNIFYGENDIITDDNYLIKLKELFGERKFQDLKNQIIDKIDSYIENEKESTQNSNGIIQKIYQKGYINKNTIDLISVIIDFVKKEIISKYIDKILCNLENNNILTTLLVLNNNKKLINDELQETVKEMVIQYIEKIDIEANDYKPKFILSFIIPCFIELYAKLSDFIIKDIANDFFKNEKMLRNFSYNKKNAKESDTQEAYDKKEKYLISKTFEKLEKDKFFYEFVKRIPSNLILNDYITYFLIKYCSDDGSLDNMANYYNLSYDDCKHKLINILLDIRYNNKNENTEIELLLTKIIWMLSNKDYIKKILNIYDNLKIIFEENEYIDIIVRTLEEQNLRYITHEKKNPIITTKVNECFYKIIASFCYSIIPPYVDFKKKVKSIDYIIALANGMKIIRGLNDDLNIFSIEVILIDELIKIYDILSLNEKLDGDKLKDICSFLKNNNLILQTNEKIQSEDLVGEFKSLVSAINNSLTESDKKYFELLKFIFYKEIKKVPDIRYRAAIFQEVVKDAEVIINSNDIFQILLFPIVKPKKDIFSKSINEILKATDYDVAVIIENILSETENRDYKIYNALNETLLYYFEKNSLIYFYDISHGKETILFDNDDDDKNKDNKDKDKKNEKKIGPLKLFNKCVKYLLDYNKEIEKFEGKNKNICKLFCLGYIRAYCNKFIDLVDSESPNLGDASKIIKEINNSKDLTKNISFYVWKAIYNKNKKNIDIFINPEYISKYRLKEYNCFKSIEIKENPFSYERMNEQDKDLYEKFNETLEKYNEVQFKDVDLEEFKKNKAGIDLFYFSTSSFILSRLKQKQFINQPIYQNFFDNVCVPLFKNNDKIFSAIKILFEPKKYDKLQKELGITSENLNIILHSYRYFINELNSNSQNSVYSILYGRRLDQTKFKNSLFPGNDIKNIPIYSIYAKIIDHFNNIPNQGCFVCLCKEGGHYHSIKGGIPSDKYLNLKCKNCGEPIGAFMNDRGFYAPIKRQNYYRILKTNEEAEYDAEKNNEKYNSMSLEIFRDNYILTEFETEKGIQNSDEDFFLKDSKIVRSLSQISYRILNYILYSHLLFYKIYNETKSFDKYLPEKMSWIKVISECWTMIEHELNKLGINSINLFMNYIFSDLFSSLNKHKSIADYNELDEFEKNLDILIHNKIINFKEKYKTLNKSMNDNFSFQDFIEEKYDDLNNKEYPFYNYFYYCDYINETYLLNQIKTNKEKYPVLCKILENNSNTRKNKYSLDNLPNFNEVLNLFSEKYCYSIKRDKALFLQLKDLKDDELYLNNRKEIKEFLSFYNKLELKDEKNQNLKLSEESKLADFFIDDNNEFGKSYKKIYAEFIKEQNKEISKLLDSKIDQEIFERDCKNKINIQSANSNEIFITTFSEKFSFDEVIFNSSYRKIALDRNYNSHNQFEVHLDLIEDEMTELLLKNRKLFNDSIINFVYSNEKLEFENKNIITEFNRLYKIEKINIKDKIILYKFYQDNKEKNLEFFITILNNFNQLITFLNNNKKLLNEENIDKALNLKDDSKINEALEKFTKVSDDFITLFKENDSLIISKTSYLFEYYRDLIFQKIKYGLKAFQTEIDNEQEQNIKTCFEKQTIIDKKIFKAAIRSFIVLFLNFEKDKENNIKQNENNIINYLNDLDDIWDITTISKENFKEELNNLKQLNIKVNQIISLYDFLGDDINPKYFEDVQKEVDKEKEIEKIIEKEKDLAEEVVPENKDEDEDNDTNSDYFNKSEESEDSEDPDSKYI